MGSRPWGSSLKMSYILGGGAALRRGGPRGRIRDLGLELREVSGCSNHPLPKRARGPQPPLLTLPGSLTSHLPPHHSRPFLRLSYCSSYSPYHAPHPLQDELPIAPKTFSFFLSLHKLFLLSRVRTQMVHTQLWPKSQAAQTSNFPYICTHFLNNPAITTPIYQVRPLRLGEVTGQRIVLCRAGA